MINSSGYKDQRRDARVNSELPAVISIGSQLSLQGQLKDLSLKSAFVRIKNSIFIQSGDEIGLTIGSSSNAADDAIQVTARISRIVGGEGFAVYFTKMNDASLARLQKLLQENKG